MLHFSLCSAICNYNCTQCHRLQIDQKPVMKWSEETLKHSEEIDAITYFNQEFNEMKYTQMLRY